jgi:hypothetical protein
MRGRAIPLSPSRRVVNDLMRYTMTVPSYPAQRMVDVSAVIAARSAHTARPAWPGIFAKAYGIAAQEFPDLRRIYLNFPRPHFYEYPTSIAAIIVERIYAGERCAFPCLIKDPARRSLTEITEIIRRTAEAPLEELKEFQRLLRIGRLPGPLRRPLWWISFNVGRMRANSFGTFGCSAVAALGAEALNGPLPNAATVQWGMFGKNGELPLRLIFDHRVYDLNTAARVLARLEEILNGPIVKELRS